MLHALPALHQGHAPIYLHQAFEDALDAYAAWTDLSDEPLIHFEGKPVLISQVFGRMRGCSDLLPQRLVADVQDIVGDRAPSFGDGDVVFSEAAFLLRALCVERFKASQHSPQSRIGNLRDRTGRA